MDGGGTAPVPSPAEPYGHVGHASSALAAISVAVILLYLFWRFMWQYKKGVPRNDGATGRAASTLPAVPRPAPSCPSRTACSCWASEAERRGTAPLPVFVYVAAVGAEKAECAVCLVEFGHGEAGRLVPGCGHGFHAACIETWFRVNSTCPLCRTVVLTGGEDERSAGGAERV